MKFFAVGIEHQHLAFVLADQIRKTSFAVLDTIGELLREIPFKFLGGSGMINFLGLLSFDFACASISLLAGTFSERAGLALKSDLVAELIDLANRMMSSV